MDISPKAFHDSLLDDLHSDGLQRALAYATSPSHAGSYSGPSSASSPDPSGFSEPSPAAESGPEHAGPSRSVSSSPPRASSSSNATRKRIRPKVDLAPGQPPTARGNPRIRVFVACYQCRARKIRCDGAKPICHNCQKRPSEASQCNYDSGPNRRGREKGGSRARPANHNQGLTKTQPPERRRSSQRNADPPQTPSDTDVSEHTAQSGGQVMVSPSMSQVTPETEFPDLANELAWEFDDPLLFDIGFAQPPFGTQVAAIVVTPPQANDEDQNRDHDQQQSIPSNPGAQFARDTWWDALLTFYTLQAEPDNDMQMISLSPAQRSSAMKAMMTDLKALLQSSPCWFSYINLPRFFDTLFNPIRRHNLQPSLLLSALALGTLSTSSEVEHGARGRQKALKLLEMAHGALEGALATGWVDIGLAQAALLILFFEMQSHPLQSLARSRSALLLLDSLFRLFSLMSVDEGLKSRGRSPSDVVRATARNEYNPAVHLGILPQPQYPSLQGTLPRTPSPPNSIPHLTARLFDYIVPPCSPMHRDQGRPQRGCKCASYSLGHNWPAVRNVAPSWSATMMWPEGLSEGEYQREESRRLVWAAIVVIANYNLYTSAAPDDVMDFGRLFVRESESFALMFPGEALAATGVRMEADDIWTLHMRTMHLMHACMRIREAYDLSAADRAQLAVQAWLEVDDLEKRLERHTCDLDTSFGFQTKEMLFSMRMLTSYEFQKFIPQVTTNGNVLFYRDKAEDWLRTVERGSDYIWQSINNAASPTQDHRKSLLIYWYVASVRRAVALWKGDNSLTQGLILARTCAERAEFLMMYWPNMRMSRFLLACPLCRGL
ncbi:hypothetical protein C8Q80DRAFT_1183246 [Daedaleopsis nitida]|nr:hypothetical protein C8Q80DRAFT_1183246 [Daedaleopsis nitida]